MEDLDFGATIKGFATGQKVFNRYTLERILGRGGMGVVWLAKDGELDRPVALKFLPEVVAMDKDSLDELRRETKRNLELTHPNIVRIYDFVQDGRTAAISMEYIDGASLSALKTEQPDKIFPVAKLEPWLKQLCGALAYAHEDAKVVHRDLKPANLMIDARGKLKITDFGIARSISDSVSRVSAQAGSSGTPVYMSPEQMMGEKPAVTDDIYALGATLYELLTGKPPFHSGNIIAQVQSKVPPSVADRRKEFGVTAGAVPEHWEKLISSCLAKDLSLRPQSMAEVGRLIDGVAPASAVKSEPPIMAPAAEITPPAPVRSSRRRIWTGIGLAVVAALSALTYIDYQDRKQKEAEAEQAAAAELANRYYIWKERVYALEFNAKATDEEIAALEREMAQFPGQQPEAQKLLERGRGFVARARKALAEVQAKEAQALAGILAKIDAFTDGAAPELRPQTEQAVTAYLAKAPANHRTEVQNRWKTRQTAWETARKNDFLNRQIKVPVGAGAPMVLAPIAAGEMTRTEGKLRVSRAFWIGLKPVSQAQWEALMPAKNLLEQPGVKDLPARMMLWSAATEYCRRLTESERVAGRLPAGYRYELPTEGEWQLAVHQLRQLGLGSSFEVETAGDKTDSRHYREWTNDWHGPVPKGDLLDPTGPEYGSIGAFSQPQKLIMTGGYWRQTYGAGSASTFVFRVVLTSRADSPAQRLVPMQGGSTLTFMRIPGGSGEFNRPLSWGSIPATKPIYQVTRPFWMAERVVTQGEWRALMASNPAPSARQSNDWPAEALGWSEVQEFCRRLTERERAAGRLFGNQRFAVPTELQWIWGKTYNEMFEFTNRWKTTVLGEGQAAWQYGIEWCRDWYTADVPGGTLVDYTGPASGNGRVGHDAGGRFELPLTPNPPKAVLRLILVNE